ncbi:COG4705 family protein [Streptacidiphilus fuscans]|uniref:Membrane-anchored protein n=1 Tax=Streptacidiphilus fuscans TaxID=2789292 RepID=A0A931FHK9_9ACTN|nr:hypothetical protein [Streptacidiphilus fuscans]MBF9071946.1 hypothetical protein [Streptacidiphilus fuscans]
MTSPARHARSGTAAAGVQGAALRVPGIVAAFWIVKGLSTAMGEATSDYLVGAMVPQIAVLIGFVAFLVALVLQFRMRRYWAWTYWFAVAMVGIFGTMAADVMHVALGVPYTLSSALYAVLLFLVFFVWKRTEGTLSIHSIDTPRREAFYWATVVATFAMGTALGDFTAFTLRLGYFTSAGIFAALILIPAAGYRFLNWNPVACFWAAYVITRPLGASLADGFGKPTSTGGLGFGDGPVALVLVAMIVIGVAYLAVTKSDVQSAPEPELEREHASAY